MILFVDIETTGLDERKGNILEVAMVITDDNLNEQAFKQIVIGHQVISEMDTVVFEMHTKNGLLKELPEGCAPQSVERYMIEYLFHLQPVKEYRNVPLAGSTVGFDRRWLRHHMNGLEGMFSHRSIDVSSITELAKRWAPAIYEGRPKSTEMHRALPDARGSIELLRYYRDKGFISVAK